MPLDPSIALQYKPFQVPSQTNALAQILQLQGAQQQNALAAGQLQDQQTTRDEMGRIRNALTGLAPNADLATQSQALRGTGTLTGLSKAAEIDKQAQALAESKAKTGHLTAQAEGEQFKTAHAKATTMLDLIGSATDQASYDAAMARGVAMGLTPDPNAPAQFDPRYVANAQQQAMTAVQRIEQAARQRGLDLTERGQNMTAATAKAGQQVQLATNAATNATSTANNAATNATHLKVAGLGEDGTPSADVAQTVKAIGEYRMQPPTLQALRNPRVAAVMDQVAREYPGFDATQYGARQKAAKDFSTGKDGQAVQSANTAVNHLETLRELAAAQANGNIPLFNQVANEWAKQTGQAAPTNLQAAVTMVGPEISKAVVGAGGGVDDRKKVDGALASLTKGAPAQAVGTIGTMLDLFGGRLTEAQRTYERTTGRKDFADTLLSPAAAKVLAARTPAAAGAHPAEIADLLNKYGRK